jgi:flagellar basal-body rod modification protein FlgD
MDDFFQLMVAQLKNQDMFSPMDNSEFMAQMAQFSMVNALMDMSELSSVSYSTSLIGKSATVAFLGPNGAMGSDTGIVSAVNLYNGTAQVVINGVAYDLSNVMTVNDALSGKSYANSLVESSHLIGKTAELLHTGEDGTPVTVSGVITGVKLDQESGEMYAVIDGKSYPLTEISAIRETEPAADPE